MGSRLGIVVEPSLVRLIPEDNDRYVWVRQPERELLFTRQLSKHSVGAYMELCREVGISFEAVARPESTGEVSEGGEKVHSSCFALQKL
jgi:hypothetical protein